MRPLRAVTISLAALAALAFAAPGMAAAPNAPTIQIGRTAFTPSAVTIAAGGSVNWVNRDTIDHQLSAPDAKLISPTLTPTDNYGFTFGTAGTFTITDKTGITMTVTVTPTPRVTVHLNVAPKAVVFGTWVKVNGNLDPGDSGQSVTVQSQPCGASTWSAAKTVTTGAGGAFSVPLRPRNNTTYRVAVGSSIGTVAAHVAPKLVLRKLGGGRYQLRVNGPATGSAVSIQTHSGSKWKIVTTVRVPGVAKTIALNLKHGTMLRASMDTHQAGQCLDAGVSNMVIA